MPSWAPSDLLDKHDAADYLSMSPHTLRNHRYHPDRGTFPAPDRRIGSSDCWRRDTLDAWREKHPTNRPEETRA